jgi:anaerobic selenocysteine-containing dehydrogenase
MKESFTVFTVTQTTKQLSDQILTMLYELEKNKSAKVSEMMIKPVTVDYSSPGPSIIDTIDEARIKPSSEYPFVLCCGFRRKKIMCCNRVNLKNENYVEMHSIDANKLNLKEDDSIRVTTTTTNSIDTTVRINDNLQEGYIRIPIFKDINRLTDNGQAGKRQFAPTYKFQFARVEKL